LTFENEDILKFTPEDLVEAGEELKVNLTALFNEAFPKVCGLSGVYELIEFN
jgi:hypothetical protein